MTVAKAGCELDALIAEKVMGWTDISKEHHWNYVRGCPAGWPDRDSGLMPGMHTTDVFKADYRWIPEYSDDHAAAWQVLEHPQFYGEVIDIERINESDDGPVEWQVQIGSGLACTDSFTLSVCYAALRHLGYNVDNQEVQP